MHQYLAFFIQLLQLIGSLQQIVSNVQHRKYRKIHHHHHKHQENEPINTENYFLKVFSHEILKFVLQKAFYVSLHADLRQVLHASTAM